MWFNEKTEERLDSILKIIEETDADFVCLQEVTHDIKEYFLANTYIKSILSAGGSISPNDIGTYGSIIISKYPCEFYECKFNSFMHRSLILAEACVPFHLIVATSHFESLNNAALRCEQLETTF